MSDLSAREMDAIDELYDDILTELFCLADLREQGELEQREFSNTSNEPVFVNLQAYRKAA